MVEKALEMMVCVDPEMRFSSNIAEKAILAAPPNLKVAKFLVELYERLDSQGHEVK